MASLVVKTMEQEGTNILMGYIPTSVDKVASGKLKVTLKSEQGNLSDEYDTVLMAVGRYFSVVSVMGQVTVSSESSWSYCCWRALVVSRSS
jgi:pyruvate/2-oxoglutarate dehydrogenase complex dihydrolipoamide dehydrogenase (E3) component